ncbi:MAG: hypothetical protein ACSHWU_12425 [Marinicella sp.]
MTNELQALFGQLHFIFSVLALLFGSWVLYLPKGSKKHRIMGYFYVVFMSLLLITAFLTYRLYGRFGLFHWMAIASALTLIAGMVPIWRKKPELTYRLIHLQCMYWSVIGLYMALAAEIFTRIPNSPFLTMVIGASLAVYFLGILGMLFNYKKWYKRFDRRNQIRTNAVSTNE